MTSEEKIENAVEQFPTWEEIENKILEIIKKGIPEKNQDAIPYIEALISQNLDSLWSEVCQKIALDCAVDAGGYTYGGLVSNEKLINEERKRIYLFPHHNEYGHNTGKYHVYRLTEKYDKEKKDEDWLKIDEDVKTIDEWRRKALEKYFEIESSLKEKVIKELAEKGYKADPSTLPHGAYEISFNG